MTTFNRIVRVTAMAIRTCAGGERSVPGRPERAGGGDAANATAGGRYGLTEGGTRPALHVCHSISSHSIMIDNYSILFKSQC